ncbi:MAG: efflux RND transporter periplasmic adaptor subunit [Candidatus Tectomicrobia bacterium]|nr:efflux RND transporter periplasmic adaptor subunit [Candidatus Tectomicrobia bacterium]
METDEHRSKAGAPLRTIALTAIITLILSGAAYRYFGDALLGVHEHFTAKPSEAREASEETPLYISPMHPWIVSEEPGQCPICGMDLVPKRDAPGASASSGERTIAYWRAPMNREEIYDQPGKSAMGMDLVPVYEDELVGGVDIFIDPVTQQNMGIRTAAVVREPLARTIRIYGHVTYDETRTVQVSPKSSGWIETLHVDFTGKSVTKGEPLFEIYAPELVTAQEEYLVAFQSAKRLPRDSRTGLLASARRRLQYFDIADSEIEALESTGEVRKTLVIRSPASGIVIEKQAEEGSHVKAGTTIYRIADLSRVWVEAHIFEYELPWVREGQAAEMTIPYWPGNVRSGKVTYIYPYLRPQTRDVRIRLEFDNTDLRLKPDMYADIHLKTQADEEGLLIPSEAVLRSGERNVVFVVKGGGKFTPREVTLGLSTDGGMIQARAGLAPGDVVVTSGQFLLDSESKLQEAVQKMIEVSMASAGPAETADDGDFFSDLEAEAEDDFFSDMEAKPKPSPEDTSP